MLAFTDAATALKTVKPPTIWDAAGITLLSIRTGRLLALKRSTYYPDCPTNGQWCNAGGGRDDNDSSPLHTALRETGEEITNFDPNILIGEPRLAFIFAPIGGTRFFNHIGLIEDEFTPKLDLTENTDARWVKPDEWPHQIHHGMHAFLNNKRVRHTISVCTGMKTQSPNFSFPAAA